MTDHQQQQIQTVQAIRGLLDRKGGRARMLRRLLPLGQESIPALLKVYGDDGLDARQRDAIVDAVRTFPGWEEQMVEALKYGDLEISLAAAHIGWSRATAQLTHNQRRHREEKDLKKTVYESNRAKLEEYRGKEARITLWEGLVRKGKLIKVTDKFALVEQRVKLFGRAVVNEGKIALQKIKEVELAK